MQKLIRRIVDSPYPITKLAAAASIVVILSSLGFSGKKQHKYTIKTDNHTYYADTFRLYGRGIVFEQDGKQNIIIGDCEISSNIED
jgi:hypothetical protein